MSEWTFVTYIFVPAEMKIHTGKRTESALRAASRCSLMTLAIKPRAALDGQHFHVVIIGGGIHGVALARECARTGKRTLLVEQNDFASGTTSRSTRMVHGGLRYLEQGEIELVREAAHERDRLLRERSHLVQPIEFLLVLNEKSRRSAMKVRAGLWLYQKLSGRNAKDLSEMELMRVQRGLDAGQRWSIFNYEDAQCEFPERLVAEWATEAAEAGAVVRNHCEVLAVDVAHGRARGVLLRDRLTGKDMRVDAGWIVNCAGPWADRICQRSSVRTTKPMLAGVRGSHIVLPRFPSAPGTAVSTEAADGRIVYLLPWNEQILVGTTEVADTNDPSRTAPSNEEIEYLLRTVTKMFPKSKLGPQDIKYAFAGIRALPNGQGSDLSAVTRRASIHDHSDEGAQRLLSLIGGRMSTAAATARECARKMGLAVAEPKAMAVGPGSALDPLLDQQVVDIARAGAVSEETARGIMEWHGERAMDIARMALVSAELRAPICPHTSHIVAEVVEAYRREFAVSLGDVLLRRVPVALGACWSESCSREAALRIGAVLGWNEHALGENLETFETERTAFLHRPARRVAAFEAAAD